MKRKQTLSSLKKKCWRLFSEYIRKQGADAGGTERCYTCGGLFFWKDLQAGHSIGGRHSAVLFDEEIVRPQCVRCNVFLRGNYPAFVTKLIKENGLEWWEEKLTNSRKVKKYTRTELEELIELYKRKLEALDAQR